MRLMGIGIALLVLTGCTAPDMAAIQRSHAYDDAVSLSSVTIDGVDFSDGAVDVASRHFCGSTKECENEFHSNRDKLIVAYARQPRRQKAILSLIEQGREGAFIDWRAAFSRYDTKFNRVPDPWFGGVPFGPYTTCTSFGSDTQITTTCTSRGY
jgi:hypothetical protein